MSEERRPWLRAGVLFGGTLTWTTAVFGAMAEYGLWTGTSAGFGFTLMLIVVYVLSVRTAYATPFETVRQLLGRALAALVGGMVMWSMFVFIALVLCERSARGAMLVLGVLGMLATFMVVGLFSPKRSGRRDPAITAVRALAWATVLLVSVTALMPPLAEAMARRGRRAHDTPDTDPTNAAIVGDDD
jgi:hypothetical protein